MNNDLFTVTHALFYITSVVANGVASIIFPWFHNWFDICLSKCCYCNICSQRSISITAAIPLHAGDVNRMWPLPHAIAITNVINMVTAPDLMWREGIPTNKVKKSVINSKALFRIVRRYQIKALKNKYAHICHITPNIEYQNLCLICGCRLFTSLGIHSVRFLIHFGGGVSTWHYIRTESERVNGPTFFMSIYHCFIAHVRPF